MKTPHSCVAERTTRELVPVLFIHTSLTAASAAAGTMLQISLQDCYWDVPFPGCSTDSSEPN